MERLPTELVVKIASRLYTSDVARLKAVNRSFNQLAGLKEVQEAAFKNTWGLAKLEDQPVKPKFYLGAGLAHFVIRVKLNAKSSIASLLVRFKVEAATLRVVNNCTSDFALQCRPSVYVPVPSKEAMIGKTGTFFFDPTCRRQFVVLQETTLSQNISQDKVSMSVTMDTLARSDNMSKSCSSLDGWDESEMTQTQKEAMMRKLSQQMGRGLSIDDATASYYLHLSKGNMKEAIMTYQEDLLWEEGSPVGILPLRERIPISEYPE